MQVLEFSNKVGHGGLHLLGESATHPIDPPSAVPAALRILAMAQAIAVVRALPARPMMARSDASNCRIQAQFFCPAAGAGAGRGPNSRSANFAYHAADCVCTM